MVGGGTFHVEIDITPWWTDRQVYLVSSLLFDPIVPGVGSKPGQTL